MGAKRNMRARSAEDLRASLEKQRALSFCRVDWGLPMLQVDVCFLGCHLQQYYT